MNLPATALLLMESVPSVFAKTITNRIAGRNTALNVKYNIFNKKTGLSQQTTDSTCQSVICV